MSEFQDFLKEQLQDDEFRKEWKDIQPEMNGFVTRSSDDYKESKIKVWKLEELLL